ncbi:MAG: hypothetical protein II656_08835, partial [Ruminococcus sp.]|nr:hypothetical protein [Ruminococcus sp.]
MSNIKYNKQEEAFELPYKLWENMQTVRFYVENESEIMDNLSAIAGKLAKLDGSRKHLAELIISDGFYEGSDTAALAKNLSLENVYVDIDEDEIVVCIDVDSFDGYMPGAVHIELFEDEFEIT